MSGGDIGRLRDERDAYARLVTSEIVSLIDGGRDITAAAADPSSLLGIALRHFRARDAELPAS